MGSLILPTSGSVYIDANAIIYSVERIEPYRELLAPMWQKARAGRFALASSELVVLETLIKSLREGNVRLETLFRSIVSAYCCLFIGSHDTQYSTCRELYFVYLMGHLGLVGARAG